MNGIVDQHDRALLAIQVRKSLGSPPVAVTAWIDTAFDGHPVFPAGLIGELGLEPLVQTDALLADGSRAVLETHLCIVDWFGEKKALQVIASDCRRPLLGIGLLTGRVLHIDFAAKVLSLE